MHPDFDDDSNGYMAALGMAVGLLVFGPPMLLRLFLRLLSLLPGAALGAFAALVAAALLSVARVCIAIADKITRSLLTKPQS